MILLLSALANALPVVTAPALDQPSAEQPRQNQSGPGNVLWTALLLSETSLLGEPPPDEQHRPHGNNVGPRQPVLSDDGKG